MGLIQDRKAFFPNFAEALRKQSPSDRELGRCAVLEFQDKCGPTSKTFVDSVELRQYLLAPSSSPTVRSKGQPRRRLFILEDLPCNHILTLGSRLRAPPSFFAGHYDDPAMSSFNHRCPFKRWSRSQFRIRYATSNRVEVDQLPDPSNTIFAFNTNVCRYLHTYGPQDLIYDEARSHHTISFWSSSVDSDGSWNAVLLVDPAPVGYVRCLLTMHLLPLRTQLRDEKSMPRHYLFPEMELLPELPEEVSEWAYAHAHPHYKSMFDDILNLITSRCRGDITDPMAAVEIPRKLVIGINIAFLRRRFLNLLRIQRSQFKPMGPLRHNYLSSFSESSLSTWHHQFFNFIVGSCAAMKEFCREMDENMVALGLPVSATELATADCERISAQWEFDGWRSVQDLARAVEGLTQSLAMGYLQYITIQEARISNMNARSLSRITVLTMLFIPLSTVASIFSMSGDYLPGSAKSWVFWAVAIPILIILASIYWRQRMICNFGASR
ncbi:hypothetical protein CC78DRAFT_551196 [Lojkania enalia]|uniref:Uncharacterized protein n=1 Tax=Lojkania enalia TaxID=147567 RepID=A0A9P4N6R0_9PLEO|nr:hypothetical protein CC78DRAFT_551196 [Didymosphaeria enalia]